MNYETQKSYKKDENGILQNAKWGEKGSSRPDAYNKDTNSIVEVKNYNINRPSILVKNIKEQTDKRKEVFGEDVHITEVIDVTGQNPTVKQMNHLTERLEKEVPDIDLDYRW